MTQHRAGEKSQAFTPSFGSDINLFDEDGAICFEVKHCIAEHTVVGVPDRLAAGRQMDQPDADESAFHILVNVT